MNDLLKRLQTLEAREAKRQSQTRRILRAVLLPLLIITPIAVLALPARNIFTAGDIISAGDVNQNFETLWTEIEALRAAVDATAPIRENLTLTVHPAESAGFQTIDAALASLDGRLFASDVTVTVKLLPGTHTVKTPLSPDHPQSNQIRIVGDDEAPSLTVIKSDGNVRVVEMRQGRHLKMLSGVTLDCAGASVGLTISNNATINTGNLIIQGCAHAGIQVLNGGDLQRTSAAKGAYSEFRIGTSTSGAIVGNGSTANLKGLVVAGLNDEVGNGIYVHNGSFADCTNCEASAFKNGLFAENAVSLLAKNAYAHDNSESGFISKRNAVLIARKSGSSDNGQWGYTTSLGGVMQVPLSGSGANPVAYNCLGTLRSTAGAIMDAPSAQVATGCNEVASDMPSEVASSGVLLVGNTQGISSFTNDDGYLSGP